MSRKVIGEEGKIEGRNEIRKNKEEGRQRGNGEG